jgi:hypothetical protein
MLIRNVQFEQVQKAAEKVGVRVIEWRPVSRAGRGAYRFRLGLGAERDYQRLSASTGRGPNGAGHRIAAVCWHGHRDFYRALFRIAPEARVQTTLTRGFERGHRYYTAENFERVYQETDRNIGSLMSPMAFSEACTC